jgi:hypothetical protein
LHHFPPAARIVTLVVLASLVWLVGCAGSERVTSVETPEDLRLLAVEVENFRGQVEVRVDEGRNDVAVEGRAFGVAFENDVDADGELARAVTLDAMYDESEPGIGVVRVRTRSLREVEDHAVALRVLVPRLDGVRVVNRGGLVEVVGGRGRVEIENHQGPVEFRTDHPMRDEAQVLVTDGSVYWQVPPGSTGVYDLETLDGESVIKNRVSDADRTYASRDVVQTNVAGGNNRVVLRTNRGDLRVWLMEDPEALTRVFRGPVFDFSEGLFLKGSRRFTRNLPDDTPREGRSGVKPD